MIVTTSVATQRPAPRRLLAGTRDVPAQSAPADLLRLCRLVEQILDEAGRQAPEAQAGKKVA